MTSTITTTVAIVWNGFIPSYTKQTYNFINYIIAWKVFIWNIPHKHIISVVLFENNVRRKKYLLNGVRDSCEIFSFFFFSVVENIPFFQFSDHVCRHPTRFDEGSACHQTLTYTGQHKHTQSILLSIPELHSNPRSQHSRDIGQYGPYSA